MRELATALELYEPSRHPQMFDGKNNLRNLEMPKPIEQGLS